MEHLPKIKTGFIIGVALIFVAILIGILFRHDVAFIFAGIGTSIIGITILAYLNKDDK